MNPLEPRRRAVICDPPRGARRCYAPLAPWGGSHITALSPQLTGVHSRITLLSSGDTLYESPSPRSITSAIHINNSMSG